MIIIKDKEKILQDLIKEQTGCIIIMTDLSSADLIEAHDFVARIDATTICIAMCDFLSLMERVNA